MLQNLTREIKSTVAPLLSGIVQDAEKLVRKEVELAKTEMQQEVGKAKESALYLAIAGATLALSVNMLAVGVALLLTRIAPAVPLWGSFFIVSFCVAGLGVYLLKWGQVRAKSVDPVPRETIDTLKENKEWMQKSLQS